MGIVKEFCDLTKNTRKNNKILAWLNIYTTVCLFIPSESHVKHILLLQIEFHFVLYRLKQTLISLWESAAGAIFYCYPQPFTSSLKCVCVFPFFISTLFNLLNSLPLLLFWFRYQKIEF